MAKVINGIIGFVGIGPFVVLDFKQADNSTAFVNPEGNKTVTLKIPPQVTHLDISNIGTANEVKVYFGYGTGTGEVYTTSYIQINPGLSKLIALVGNGADGASATTPDHIKFITGAASIHNVIGYSLTPTGY